MLQSFRRNITITVTPRIGAERMRVPVSQLLMPEVASMNPDEAITQPTEQNDEQSEYEAPRIESAMTPEDLAREVQYAGVTDQSLPLG